MWAKNQNRCAAPPATAKALAGTVHGFSGRGFLVGVPRPRKGCNVGSVPAAGAGYSGQQGDADQNDRGDHDMDGAHPCQGERPPDAAYDKCETDEIDYKGHGHHL